MDLLLLTSNDIYSNQDGQFKGIECKFTVMGVNNTNKDLNYKIVNRRPGDVERIYGSPEKANKILGWESTTPIHETILNAWKWEQNRKY